LLWVYWLLVDWLDRCLVYGLNGGLVNWSLVNWLNWSLVNWLNWSLVNYWLLVDWLNRGLVNGLFNWLVYYLPFNWIVFYSLLISIYRNVFGVLILENLWDILSLVFNGVVISHNSLSWDCNSLSHFFIISVGTFIRDVPNFKNLKSLIIINDKKLLYSTLSSYWLSSRYRCCNWCTRLSVNWLLIYRCLNNWSLNGKRSWAVLQWIT
jgi:hypothetical protein